jgi:hypothetical protein
MLGRTACLCSIQCYSPPSLFWHESFPKSGKVRCLEISGERSIRSGGQACLVVKGHPCYLPSTWGRKVSSPNPLPLHDKNGKRQAGGSVGVMQT